MKNILTERTLKVFLPAAGYILALGILAALGTPLLHKAYTSWKSHSIPSVEEAPAQAETTREMRPVTLVARTSGSYDYSDSLVSDSTRSLNLPKPKNEDEEQEEMLEATDSSLQDYMPLLGGKQKQTTRRLTKAERKRIQEKRDRQENWAYADPDEVTEDAEKDVWEKDSNSKDKQEEFEEETTVEAIVLGDKKNLLLYRFISGDSDKTAQQEDAPVEATASESATDASSEQYTSASQAAEHIKLYDAKSTSLSFSDSSFYKGHELMTSDNPLLAPSDKPGTLNFFGNGSSSPVQNRSLGLNTLDNIKASEKNIESFRAMIAPKAASPLSSPNKAIITSSSANTLPGNQGLNLSSGNSGLSLPTTPLPGSVGANTPSSLPSTRQVMPSTPERSLMREGGSTRAIPRLIIKR